MKTKVILAYSGGLDTSFCIPYLTREKKMEVHTLLVNTGGFSEKEVNALEEKALKLGAVTHKTIDIREMYYNRCLRYLIYGNVLKNKHIPAFSKFRTCFPGNDCGQLCKGNGSRGHCTRKHGSRERPGPF
jgi:argininosuccinate synthase